jgi:hypothetical protein
LRLAPRFFAFLALEHTNNNVHNVRLCRMMVATPGVVDDADLLEHRVAEKVVRASITHRCALPHPCVHHSCRQHRNTGASTCPRTVCSSLRYAAHDARCTLRPLIIPQQAAVHVQPTRPVQSAEPAAAEGRLTVAWRAGGRGAGVRLRQLGGAVHGGWGPACGFQAPSSNPC